MSIIRIPGVAYGAAPRAESKAAALGQPVDIVVVHDTGNPTATKENESHYAATRTDLSKYWTSCHAYTDTGGVLGSLRLDRQAWAAYSYANANGWHIEMCGMNAGDAHAVPAATIAITATLVRQLCELGGVPMVKLSPADVAAGKRGVCGHRDITLGLHVGTHDDPGPAFNWTAFMQQVNSGGPVAPAPQTGEDDMGALMMWRDDPAGTVFYAQGALSQHVGSEEEMADRVNTLAHEMFPLFTAKPGTRGWNAAGTVRIVARRELIPPIVGKLPPGWEDHAAFQSPATTPPAPVVTPTA